MLKVSTWYIRINANTPTVHDPAISPLPHSPHASRRTSVPHRAIPAREADQRATSCFGCPPPKLQAPPHSSHRSISIVLSRGEEEKVSIMFIPLRISSETHLVFYYFPAAAVTSADLVSWGCRRLSVSRPNRNRRYRATTKARRWVLCFFCAGSHPKLTSYFYGRVMYLRPVKLKAVEGLGHLSMASSIARLRSNPLKRWESNGTFFCCWICFIENNNYF